MASKEKEIAHKINEDKIYLETLFYPKVKKIFNNIADNLEISYLANDGQVDVIETIDVYQDDFSSASKEILKKSIDRYGFSLRRQIFGDDFVKSQNDTINDIAIVDNDLDAKLSLDEIQDIDKEFLKASIAFAVLQSKKITDYITATNVKDALLIIEKAQTIFEEKLIKLKNNLALADPTSKSYERIKRNIENLENSKDSVIAKNLNKIQKKRGESRSRLIVEQTVGLGESWARNEEATILKKNFDTNKTWVSILDNATRIAHAEADGQTVDVDDRFFVDGELLEFPRDPNGSIGNIANCRCQIIIKVSNSKS